MRNSKEIYKLKIALTSDCVLRCSHCRIDKEAGLTIPLSGARAAVGLMLASPGGMKRLELYGGEPLLKPALLRDITSFARRRASVLGKRLCVSVASNGLLLNRENLDWMRGEGVNLSVSLSGSAASHDLCRRDTDGRGSARGALKGALLAMKVLGPGNVVALNCVHPDSAGRLAGDFRRMRREGFEYVNIECVHGCGWPASAVARFRGGMNEACEFVTGLAARDRFMAMEPFLEFLRCRGTAPNEACPLYRDLELYPDGSLSLYPFAFIDYARDLRAVRCGSAREGLSPRFAGCRPGSAACGTCIADYYVLPGLDDGSAAYSARTDILKRTFLGILRRSKKEPAFGDYLRRLFRDLDALYLS
ncbi:MAG: hypothetical protein FD189_1446 [Elusimicrobia bacterium]|nr:MAG: hypothetical protein FD154_8 [Elusimicrobiota bacterium]KAF0155337.1 MAG: hypothetical protein FD189_1446 [Elusimicrobiota bacterium]